MSFTIDKVEYWPIDKIVPYAKNARIHNNDQINQLIKSIEEFGFINPILVSGDHTIIAGHGRLIAAKTIGYEKVPVILLDHLSSEQQRALIIADNKIAENAGWDEEILKLELADLDELGFDINVLGFDAREIDELLIDCGIDEENNEKFNEVPEGNKWPVSRLGDVWILGKHRLLCGNSADKYYVDLLFNGNSANMTFTDPPYNVNYGGSGSIIFRGDLSKYVISNDNMNGEDFKLFLEKVIGNIFNVTIGACYICMSSKELQPTIEVFKKCDGKLSVVLCWVKNNIVISRGHYHYQSEFILYGNKKGNKLYWNGARDQSNVWFFNTVKKNDLHPTMKPVELIEKAIKNSSKINDVIFDPFGGSGSTLIACDHLNRCGYLIEIEPKYVDVIIKRWEQLNDNNIAILEKTGQTFEELSDERLLIESGVEIDMNNLEQDLPKRGRGRPRKVMDDDQESNQDLPKRGRGRPRKVMDDDQESNQDLPKRGRGRPRKVMDDDQESNQDLPKRGRGRPRKVMDNDQESNQDLPKRGRGRPRKVMDDDQESNQDLPKRGRGRPRKVMDDDQESNQDLPKRGRGRPRKVMDDDQESNQDLPKRGRGRPRKVMDDDQESNQDLPKRGRGRPRKVVDDDQESNQDLPKRGRGRPRKVMDDDQESNQDLPKRGRGRPRKVVDDDQVDDKADEDDENDENKDKKTSRQVYHFSWEPNN